MHAALPKSWAGFSSQRLQEMLNWHHRKLSAEKRDWLPGCRRELQKGIRFLTPCSSCHSLPSSKIFNDFLLLKRLKASPGWYFMLSLIRPLWGITKHFHAYYLIWSSQRTWIRWAAVIFSSYTWGRETFEASSSHLLFPFGWNNWERKCHAQS